MDIFRKVVRRVPYEPTPSCLSFCRGTPVPESLRISRKRPESRFDFLELEKFSRCFEVAEEAGWHNTGHPAPKLVFVLIVVVAIAVGTVVSSVKSSLRYFGLI